MAHDFRITRIGHQSSRNHLPLNTAAGQRISLADLEELQDIEEERLVRRAYQMVRKMRKEGDAMKK